MEKIAILNVSSIGRDFPEHIEELEKIGEVTRYAVAKDAKTKELLELLHDVTYIIMGTSPTLDSEFFDGMKHLKLITRHGIGFNHIDLESAKQHNVYVCNITGRIERDAVAEQASTLLSMAAKKMLLADYMVRNDEWLNNRGRLMGYELTRKVTGVIGCGNIGSRFKEIMEHGYQNKILIYDPYQRQTSQHVDLETLLRESDFISLHANLTKENYHMIDKEQFAMMKKTVVLVNTARGALINEAALVDALAEKRIGGFGADVLTSEPVEVDNPLLKLENTVFSPHVGVYNYACICNMDLKVMKDIELVHKGQKPVDIVNNL